MGQKFANNARSTLASGITDSATTLTVAAPAADLFPVANVGSGSLPSTSDWFKATLENDSGQCEIIYVRTRTSGSAVFSNVMRGQEGTTARAYSAGDVIGVRLTALDIETVVALLSGSNVFSEAQTFQQLTTHEQGVKLGSNWTIKETAGVLYFAYGGTNKAKLESSGKFTTIDTVVIGGTM